MSTSSDHRADETRPDDGADAWTTPKGLVTLTAPVGTSPYYRLEWYPVEGARKRQQSTGGRTFDRAWAKACRKESELLVGATPRTQMPARVGIAYWLDPQRPTEKGGWGYSMNRNMNYYAERYFTPQLGSVRLMDLRRAHFQACVNAAPTASEGTNVRRAANNLIAALRQGEYLLDTQTLDLSTVWWHGVRAEAAGETDEEREGFVPKWKRPSHDQVRALREAAETIGRGIWWRGLMVELAAYAGPRWSELIALSDTSFVTGTRKVNIHHRVAFEKGKSPRLVPPKMAKKRTTIFPEVTPTGYALQAAIERRLAEVAREKAAGSNPRGILFPSRTGNWLQSGNFHRDIFEPAALAAGWPSKLTERADGLDEEGRVKLRKQRSWDLTWHSLRHTFCTVALTEWGKDGRGLADTVVAQLAGHKNSVTTRRLYADAAEDAVDVALESTEDAAQVEEDDATGELARLRAELAALRATAMP